MRIRFETNDDKFYLKLVKADGRFARAQVSKSDLIELHKQIITVLPELAVHEGIKSAIERFNKTITRVENGQWRSSKKNPGSESIFTPGLDDC